MTSSILGMTGMVSAMDTNRWACTKDRWQVMWGPYRVARLEDNRLSRTISKTYRTTAQGQTKGQNTPEQSQAKGTVFKRQLHNVLVLWYFSVNRIKWRPLNQRQLYMYLMLSNKTNICDSTFFIQ